MAEWFSEYWKLVVLMVVALAVAIVLFIMAARATSSHNKVYRQQEKQLRELAELKNKYRNFTAETLEAFPNDEILKGVNVLYQSCIMKQDDPEKAFLSFSEEIRYLYVLEVFIEDESAKEFFSQSDVLLKSRILPALEMIGMSDFALRLSPIHKMYDKDDETTSLDIKEIEKLDLYMAENDILGKIKLSSAEYIKANADKLKI